MLLYAIIHLSGVKAVNDKYERLGEPAVSLDDIKRFRHLGSKCPGHPGYHLTSGVETTRTGPLGQGGGNGVGIALAGRWLAKHFNRPDFTIFDYDVYVICGDGNMVEGVSSEAASFAGRQMLGNLCWFYDSNRVTIEGHTDLAFSDDVAARFLAYGWNVQHVGDVNDQERLAEAIEIFRRTNDAPPPASALGLVSGIRPGRLTRAGRIPECSCRSPATTRPISTCPAIPTVSAWSKRCRPAGTSTSWCNAAAARCASTSGMSMRDWRNSPAQ
jgi:hypothetical protein